MVPCSDSSEITAGGELNSTPKEADPATIPRKTPGLTQSQSGGMGDSFAVLLVRRQDLMNSGLGIILAQAVIHLTRVSDDSSRGTLLT